jgi:hypothetical protein
MLTWNYMGSDPSNSCQAPSTLVVVLTWHEMGGPDPLFMLASLPPALWGGAHCEWW